ncbi:MAG: DUF421 domain-containing protein [Ruminococcus sp.]|jgi:uncharacterized membrane protein YcaP (DUF421 family)|nr:DUF421 domain-containing protein [Ruminococcus sp.]
MLVTIIRTVILYFFVIFSVRLMGKRQISDLQPSELVITLLIADIASLPMENTDKPMLSGIIPTLILVSLEIIVSVIMMKSNKFRRIVCGNPVVVIENGELNQDKMRALRMTIEDLYVQLRQLGIFSIDEVEYCIAETNGKLSVLQKPENRTPTLSDLSINTDDEGLETVVISDGEYLNNSIKLSGTSKAMIDKILNKNNKKANEVFLMTYNKKGQYKLIDKE